MNAAAKRKHQAAERRAAKSVVMSEAEAPMKGTAMEEARDERNALMAGYRRHKAKVRDDLIAGPHGRDVAALVATLKGLTPDSASALVEFVLGAEWIRQTDLDTRHAILSMIGDAIVKLRIRNGMAPFDDAIGDEPLTAFQIIRKDMIGI